MLWYPRKSYHDHLAVSEGGEDVGVSPDQSEAIIMSIDQSEAIINSIDQSEASIEITWLILTNQRPVLRSRDLY